MNNEDRTAKQKVAVIASLAISLVNFRLELLKAMARNGHRVITFAPDSDAEITLELQKIGIEFVLVPMGRTRANPLEDIKTLWALWRHFRQTRPDTILAYTMKPVIYGGIAARLAGVQRQFALITGLGYVFTDAEPSYRMRVLRFVSTLLYRTALADAERVFVYNRDDAALLLEKKIVRAPQVRFVPGSGVDLVHFSVSSVPLGPPIFLLVGRLLWDKGIREYVDAARLVRRRHPQTRFQLLGPFDSNPAAVPHHEVEKWVAEGVIEYLGETRDVRPFLAACGVFVLPSYREGIPRSALEAMATGRPIITTDAPGCREVVVDGENGMVVPVRDPERLAAAMENFITRPDLVEKFGRRSREMARERYDVHAVNRLLLEEMGLAQSAK